MTPIRPHGGTLINRVLAGAAGADARAAAANAPRVPVSESRAEVLRDGEPVGLYAPGGRLVGLLELRERYSYDQRHEAEQVYRTTAQEHPGVARLYAQGPVLLGGDVWLLEDPVSAFP